MRSNELGMTRFKHINTLLAFGSAEENHTLLPPLFPNCLLCSSFPLSMPPSMPPSFSSLIQHLNDHLLCGSKKGLEKYNEYNRHNEQQKT